MKLFTSRPTESVPARLRHARRTTIAAAGIVPLLAVTGCAGGFGAAGNGDGPTTVKFLAWDDAAVMQPLVDAFEAENPDITIDISNVADVSQYQSTLQPQLLSGTAPDIFITGSMSEMAGGGFLTDLSEEAFADRLSPANAEYGSYEGKLYGVSISSWGGAFAYNVDALAEVGVNGPEDYPQSWDEFLDLLGDLKAAGYDTPLLESLNARVSNGLCALSGLANVEAGGDLDAQVFAGETTWAEHWTEPWEQWIRLYDEKYVTRDAVGVSDDQVNQEFGNGNVPIITSASWAMQNINDLEAPFETRFMPVPGTTEGSSYLCGAASPAMAVNEASEVKEEAISFLEFMTTPEAADLYNDATGSITTTADSTPKVDAALEPLVQQIQDGDIYLPVASWKQYQDALDKEFIVLQQQMVLEEITPAEATARLDAKLAELQD